MRGIKKMQDLDVYWAEREAEAAVRNIELEAMCYEHWLGGFTTDISVRRGSQSAMKYFDDMDVVKALSDVESILFGLKKKYLEIYGVAA